MFKKILFIVIILNLIISNSLSNSKVNIAVTVDEKIITNYDINNEALYLKILNPKLNNLDEQKIINLSKESLIREIIKKNEIEKVFDLKKDNPFVNQYLEDLYKN